MSPAGAACQEPLCPPHHFCTSPQQGPLSPGGTRAPCGRDVLSSAPKKQQVGELSPSPKPWQPHPQPGCLVTLQGHSSGLPGQTPNCYCCFELVFLVHFVCSSFKPPPKLYFPCPSPSDLLPFVLLLHRFHQPLPLLKACGGLEPHSHQGWGLMGTPVPPCA